MIKFYETPQVCGLEYDEQRDLKAHPEKEEEYLKIIETRTKKRKRKKKK